MPTRDRAAYMRDYRAKKRSAPGPGVEGPNLSQDLEACREETARLKRMLTTLGVVKVDPHRPPRQVDLGDIQLHGDEPFRTFRPVPKPGRK